MYDRESFLRAIYSTPDDDLPRLVFADYLQESGEETWAEFIRLQCELATHQEMDSDRRHEMVNRTWVLAKLLHPDLHSFDYSLSVIDRGFVKDPVVRVGVAELTDPDSFRRNDVENYPEWYGATKLEIVEGRITTPDVLATMMSSPVTENVTKLTLSGRVDEVDMTFVSGEGAELLPMYDLENKPVITVRMVEALAQMRECRRLVELDLRNNDLDNDAVRALANSPHLFRLKRLYLLNGNRFKGRTWQASVERFGPDVVQ